MNGLARYGTARHCVAWHWRCVAWHCVQQHAGRCSEAEGFEALGPADRLEHGALNLGTHGLERANVLKPSKGKGKQIAGDATLTARESPAGARAHARALHVIGRPSIGIGRQRDTAQV